MLLTIKQLQKCFDLILLKLYWNLVYIIQVSEIPSIKSLYIYFLVNVLSKQKL